MMIEQVGIRSIHACGREICYSCGSLNRFWTSRKGYNEDYINWIESGLCPKCYNPKETDMKTKQLFLFDIKPYQFKPGQAPKWPSQGEYVHYRPNHRVLLLSYMYDYLRGSRPKPVAKPPVDHAAKFLNALKGKV